MESRLPPDAAKALALTDADLFIPILTFVFGEARLGGRAAVVSSARLTGDGVMPVPWFANTAYAAASSSAVTF